MTLDSKVMNSRSYWNRRYATGGNSGAGSYGPAVEKKVAWLGALEGVSSIVEVGCGDFHFGALLCQRFTEASYIGLDQSDLIVRRNNLWHRIENIEFRTPLHHAEPLPEADLVLCVDVLFHILDDQEYRNMLVNLQQAWTKYLVVSAYEYDGLKSPHVNIRKFDPAYFGKPILREVIEDDGKMMFYIFRR